MNKNPNSFFSYNVNTLIFRMLDMFSILLAMVLTLKWADLSWNTDFAMIVSLEISLFYLVGEFLSLYREGGVGRNRLLSLLLVYSTFVISLLIASFIISQLLGMELDNQLMLVWLGLSYAGLNLWRVGSRFLRLYFNKMGIDSFKVAIIGANKQGVQLANQIDKDVSLGYQLVGFYDDRDAKEDRIKIDKKHTLKGDFNKLLQDINKKHIDIVYIVLPISAVDRMRHMLAELSDLAVTVHIVPDFFVFNLMRAKWSYIGNMMTLSVFDTPFYGVGGVLKRIEDVILASIILLLITIPMIIIAILIKFNSKGPVLFKQTRYGLSGKPITVWKFRSMTVCEDGAEIKQAQKNDTRITSLGNFLRKTSLDELPQFFNALQGQMSIVGPRPHAVAHNEAYRHDIDGYMLRHLVKPGITGWAQINGYRGETDTIEKMEKRVEFDLDYIKNWSIGLDLKIIFMTIFKGFVNKNAY